jgi:hypothetical protein
MSQKLMGHRERLRRIRRLSRESDRALRNIVSCATAQVEWERYAHTCLAEAMNLAQEGKILQDIRKNGREPKPLDSLSHPRTRTSDRKSGS